MGCSQSALRAERLNQLPPEGDSELKTENGVEANSTQPVNENRMPVVPSVPPDSWYAQPFKEITTMKLTEYHVKQRGNVVFSGAYIPVGSSELDSLPGHSPLLRSTLKIGKDLVYGMAYLHSTPLFTEYYWRSRVSHYEKMCREQFKHEDVEEEGLSFTPNVLIGGTGDVQRDLHQTIYDRPYFDTFVAFKVFVDDKLVPDHYPSSKSIPNCTATIITSEAFNNWICIPVVLIGYLNNFLLSSITLYRYLSLNFVEYLLRHSSSLCDSNAFESEKDKDKTENDASDDVARRVFKVRVEVVYGCRSEMNFCTDHISKGSVSVIMTNQSIAALSSYEEKLRKLIQYSHPSRDQLVPIDRLTLAAQEHQQEQQGRPRVCLFCNSPLRFSCTICGAQLCGTATCVWRPFTGYPHGCSVHKAQV